MIGQEFILTGEFTEWEDEVSANHSEASRVFRKVGGLKKRENRVSFLSELSVFLQTDLSASFYFHTVFADISVLFYWMYC